MSKRIQPGIILALIVATITLTACSSAADAPPTVSVFFNHTTADGLLDPGADCGAVFPLPRDIPPGTTGPAGVAKAALDALFAGPTEAEQAQGYASSFSQATADAVLGVAVEGDTAYVNLIDVRQIIPEVSAACGGQAFFAAVESTLRDAVDVENVVYAIEGDPATFYEWTQIGCPPEGDLCDPAPFEDLGGKP